VWILKELSRRGVKKLQLFISNDSLGIENVIKMVYPKKLLYLILKEMNEGLNSRRFRGFYKIVSGNYHALPVEIFTQ
jgi:hypothetical protein